MSQKNAKTRAFINFNIKGTQSVSKNATFTDGFFFKHDNKIAEN